MLDNDENTLIETQINKNLDSKIDTSLLGLPLSEAESIISDNIVKAASREELEKQFELFNLNESKKNALRVIKLNSLLTRVEDQAIKRFEKRPDQISNRELLEYMQVVSNQIDKSKAGISDLLKDKPLINLTNTKNELNVNIGPQLTRESREKVVDAITGLLKQLNNNSTNPLKDITEESSFIKIEDEGEFNKLTPLNELDNIKED